MAMTMLSARVPQEELARAQEVLKEKGMTTSQLVRLVIEYVSDTGEVPDLEKWQEEARRRERMDALKSLLDAPVEGIGSRDARELLNEGRDERFVQHKPAL